jgi:hypothetical protein
MHRMFSNVLANDEIVIFRVTNFGGGGDLAALTDIL